MQVYNYLLLSVFLLTSISACASKNSSGNERPSQDRPPLEQDLPSAPNCAADGPGCKQFNPDLK